MTYTFGVAVADLADSPLDWLESIILAAVETPESERNYDLLSGYVAGIAEDRTRTTWRRSSGGRRSRPSLHRGSP